MRERGPNEKSRGAPTCWTSATVMLPVLLPAMLVVVLVMLLLVLLVVVVVVVVVSGGCRPHDGCKHARVSG